MGLLGSILKSTIDLATLPINVVVDIIEFPEIIDGKKSSTENKINTLSDDTKKMLKDIENL